MKSDDRPRVVKITKRVVECKNTITLNIQWFKSFSPGQFVMIWIPGVGEKPFSIAGTNGSAVTITVRRLGAFSTKLASMREGDVIGVRGPYGNGFSVFQNFCIVAGGVGIAAVAPLIDLNPNCIVLYGENTSINRIYRSRFPTLKFFTVDGSEGKKGFPTDGLKELLNRGVFDAVYSCGPEPLMVATASICSSLGVKCQISLERYMKCAIGICGACVCDGYRVCADGPVFNSDVLMGQLDFGKCKLDSSGTRTII